MTVDVNRAELLQELSSVYAGVAARELIEQSSCFVFRKGKIWTFNDEVAVRGKTSLKIEGAVQAAPLLKLLQKIPDDELTVELGEGELIIRGRKRAAGVRMEAEILLPIDKIGEPKDWLPLHADFMDAVEMVGQCVSKDQSQFHLLCVNITPKGLEASDDHQIARYRVKTGVTDPFLVRQTSLGHMAKLGMTHLGLTDEWLHFKNPSGLILSTRRHLHDFPNVDPFFRCEGKPVTLPKGLIEAAENAEVFTAENADANLIKIVLQAGRIRVRGQGSLGWYRETKKISYDGESMTFMIAPALLVEIVKRHNECVIAEDKLHVNVGKFQYVACLGTEEEVNGGEE